MKRLLELQHLVDTHDNPFVVLDTHFGVLSVNSAFADEFQLDLKNIIGKKFIDVFSRLIGEDKNSLHNKFLEMHQNVLCKHTCSNGNGSKRFIVKSLPIKGGRGEDYIGLSFKGFASMLCK